MGSGDRRDRRQADGHPRQAWRGCGLLARLGEVHERGRLSDAEVRRLLGHELDRPPGPHLPLDDGRRRRQHLGLRRPDQLLQRHPQRQDDGLHRLERGRGAPGGDAASPRLEGDQPRQHDRLRSAVHAHGRARDRVCAVPLRHRHSARLGPALARVPERLGGQGLHRQARLRHGRRPQGGRQVDARRGRARHRRAGRAAQARRREIRQGEAGDDHLVHGRDPAHGRHRERPRLLHRLPCDRQCRLARHRRQHLPRPHQRAGRDRPRAR